ncbi:helix-turn-helix domain-containing protein [Paracoccaceae bacterium GXU_MW_L88]
MEIELIDQLSALGHAPRLAVFRLLMRRYPDSVPAGEIAAALDLKASTLSALLTSLTHAGLITGTRHGTSRHYTIAMEGVEQMTRDLFLGCCKGRPLVICAPDPDLPTGENTMSSGKYNVLFICIGNSARSIIAESVLRHDAGDKFNAYSAGTKPASEPNPFAMQMLKEAGHDVSALRSKNMDEFVVDGAPKFDFVFTVCDHAANEECPVWPGQPVSGHWGLPDPAKVEGTDAEKALAFQRTFGAMKNRISIFASLPIATLDRTSLQAQVDEIGRSREDV